MHSRRVCSACQRDAPPIFFSVLAEKKTGRARSKRKGRLARSGAVALRARRGSAYRCLLRFCLAFGHASLFCESALPSRGGWCRGRRGARTHLTSSSFRAFRFATRSLGGRRGCCVVYAEAFIDHRPAAAKNRRSSVSQPSPGQRFPQGPGVSVPDRREGQPAIPRRRQEVCAGADRPAEAFFLFHRARPILFLWPKKRMGGGVPQPDTLAEFPAQWGAPQQPISNPIG